MKRTKRIPRVIVLEVARDEQLTIDVVPQHRPNPHRALLRLEIDTDQLSRQDACDLLEYFANRLRSADPEWLGQWPRASSRLSRRVPPAQAALHAELGVVELSEVRRRARYLRGDV